MSSKKVVTIFKIDMESSLFELGEGENKVKPDDAITQIKKRNEFKFYDYINDDGDNKRYKSLLEGYVRCPINNEIAESFSLDLYYHIRSPEKYDWQEFYSVVTEEEFERSKTNNILCFIIYKGTDLYVVSTGSAHNVITEYIDFNFGFEFANVFLDRNSVEKASSRDFTGYFYARDYYLRRALNVDDIEGFGSVYSAFLASFKPKIFGYDFFKNFKKEFFKVKCEVANGVKIHKSIDFNSLMSIISAIDEGITKLSSKVAGFNSGITRLSKRDPKHDELKQQIIEDVFKYLTNNKTDIDYEICNKDYYNYYSASQYYLQGTHIKTTDDEKEFFWTTRPGFTEVMEPLKNTPSILEKLDTLEKFKEKFFDYKLISEHDEDDSARFKTSGPIFSHLQGEISSQSDKKSYFLLDGYWYSIDDSYIKKINDIFAERLGSMCLGESIGLEKWTLEGTGINKKHISEGEYNLKHYTKGSFVVADKLCINNIEYFDLLHFTDDILYLIQVKKGFDGSLREACSQIRQAVNSVKTSIATGKKELAELYSKISNNTREDYFGKTAGYKDKNKQNLCSLNKSQFLNLFNGRKIVYVIAFLHSKELIKENVKEFKSNIAKAEIISLNKYFKTVDTEDTFKICQIESA
jgi:uncharacterized protein (TIGR04141 family)